nr:hypothetical protein [Tanacetum cinerariifolium]
MVLPPRDQRHQYLRFEGLRYTNADITDFEERLGRIYGREIHHVQVFDFEGLTYMMAEGLSGRMLMEHKDAQGQSVFTSRAWMRLFKIRGLLTLHELEAVYFGLEVTYREGDRVRWIRRISSARDFLGTTLSYTLIKDSMLRLCHRLIACNIAERSHAPKKVVEGAPGVDEGDQAVLTPIQAPQPPTARPARTMA